MLKTGKDVFGNKAQYEKGPLSDLIEEQFKSLVEKMILDSFIEKEYNPSATSERLQELIKDTQVKVSKLLANRNDIASYHKIPIDLSWRGDRERLVNL
ncbi:Hypothetical protein KNT65_gp100 [Escherichia phage EcS1]|uniref:Uncharacterized protein n=1 Tax=Escherichia phage EcS1 TaxID=2083276 RepID=A0A2Z5ZC11_9CAUD|nr:Hypothetical protein KNT65_gp100 [Escherichia phage EcS1]BBC78148.1 Hypothetical protein [Escherichia phage EcS1]